MATIQDGFTTWILTQTAITAYIGANIFYAQRPDGLDEDYICYQIVVPSNRPASFGDKKTVQPTLQIDVYSKSMARAWEISDLLVTALYGFEGALVTGLDVVISEINGPVVEQDLSDEQWYHGRVDWTPEYSR